MEDENESNFWYYFEKATALIFWVYLALKVFVFDFDNFLMTKYLPKYAWILEFKLVLILGFIAVVWLMRRNKSFYFWIAYVLIAPFILILFTIPAHLFKSKNWVGAFALIGITLSFFRRLKFNFISASFILIAFVIISKSSNKYALYCAIAFLGVNLFLILFRSVYFSFKPSMLFTIQSDALIKLWEIFKKPCSLSDDLKTLEIEKYTEQQMSKWIGNLQITLTFNRVCYFVSSKLLDFQKSRVNVVYYVLNFALLVFCTVVIFAFANYGLFRIDPKNYHWVSEPGLFSFFNYSINTLFTNSISDFYPVSSFAKSLSTAEIVCAFFLLVIMFFLVTTIQSSRHNDELNVVIASIKKQGRELDVFIESEYNISTLMAMEELQKAKSGLFGFIYYLSSNMNNPHEDMQ